MGNIEDFLIEEEPGFIQISFPSSDSIDFQVELIEPKEVLYPILDSIIVLKDECLKEGSCVDEFIFSNYYGDPTDLKPSIIITYLDNHSFDYSLCSAIFFYKNYRYNYKGEILTDFFDKRNITAIIKILDPIKKRMFMGIDDSHIYWKYIITDNGLQNIFYNNCHGYGGPLLEE